MTVGIALLCILELIFLYKLYVRMRRLRFTEQFQNILDSASMVSIIACDTKGTITLFNPGAERMLGYTAEEMVGKQTPGIIHLASEVEERGRALTAEYGRPIEGFDIFTVKALETGQDEREWTYIRKDGARLTVTLAVTVLKDSRGTITGMLGIATDITERKRMEEELIREKTLIEGIFNSVPGMLYLYDMDGHIVRWNRRHEAMTGYNSEEMARMRLLDWYKDDEESQKAVLEGIKTTVETGFGEAEANLRRKDGTKIPMYFTAAPMSIFGKEYFVGLGIDTTARKRVERLVEMRMDLMQYGDSHTLEELLRKTLDEATALTESAVGFYHFVDEDQKSLSLQAWSTRTLAEFCKIEGRGMHYPIDRAGVWVECVRVKEPVIHNDYATMGGKKGLPEGHAPVIRELVVPVLKDDRVVAILGIGNKPGNYVEADVQAVKFLADVTWEIISNKRTVDALRESEAKLSALFASMAEMVALHELVFDEAGVPVDYRIMDCNDAYSLITGIRREDALGKLATEVYGTEAAPYLEEFSRVAITGEPYRYETYFPPMDKHFAISVVSPGKNAFATITSDITGVKRVQEVIDAKNKELEQIVYVASHDLRSPLVNVEGFGRELEFSLRDIQAALDGGVSAEEARKLLLTELPDMNKSVNRIRVSASQMDKLLKGLLQLSRQGRASLQIEDTDMNECVSKVVTSLSFILIEQKAELTVEPLPPCRGDAVQLTQVFSNLVSNAIKYRDPERPPKIRISGSMVKNRPEYRVEDNGIGIAENHLEHVFELFHRLNPEKTEGEGIGLTIVRQALSRMYGEIRVESEAGKGSAFIVTLPPARGKTASDKSDDEVKKRG